MSLAVKNILIIISVVIFACIVWFFLPRNNYAFFANPNVSPDFHGIAVPPDPGVAADATLIGVDTNNNGVRDEVERALAEKYGADQNEYDGVMRVAKSIQTYLAVNGGTASTATTQSSVIAGACLAKKFGTNAIGGEQAINYILALTIDTPVRASAYKATEVASKEAETNIPNDPCQ